VQFTHVSPHLHFDGDCEAAFQMYERCFGGKIEVMMTFAGTPAESQIPAEWRNKILHATLRLAGGVLMGTDTPPGRYEKPQGFSVSLQFQDTAEAERAFNALADSGKIRMPLQQTFWSARFGMLVDRFGIPWMVNCEQAAQSGSA
jgi:PhnB protein